MKNRNTKILKQLGVAGIFLAAFIALPQEAFAYNDTIALMVQQSPVDGGTVTPEAGVHKFQSDSEIVITAVPKPGYQFVHWIGDVADSTSSRTTAYLNSPKIIIAVFERSEFEFLAADELSEIAPGGGLYQSPADYSNQGYTGGGGIADNGGWYSPRPPKSRDDFPVTPPDNNDDDIPVPDPIPEPTAIMLLSLGCLGLVRKRRELTNKNL